MEEKSIKINYIHKVIKQGSPLFPEKLSKICLYFINNNLSIDLVNYDNINVNAAFINKLNPLGISLYQALIDSFISDEKIMSLDKNFIYVQKLHSYKNVNVYTDGKLLMKLNKGMSIRKRADEIGIDHFCFWNMLSDSKVDYSISSILKVCHHFKISIFQLLTKDVCKSIFETTLTEFSVKANLTDEEIRVIQKIKSNYFNTEKETN